jgi:pSer/pThr/pTyr-binding forkhead associated (FHA) protein
MSFRLVVISGREYLFRGAPDDPEPPDAYALRDGQTLAIGRGNSADIRLSGSGVTQDVIVARRQADLELKDGVARILDYGGSRGGNFRRAVAVNGQSLEGNGTHWLPLSPGDEIRVGDTAFRLEKDGESV